MSKSIDEIMKEFNEKMAKKESCCGKCGELTADDIKAVTENHSNDSFYYIISILLMLALVNPYSDVYFKGKADAYKEVIDKLLQDGCNK